MSQENFNFDLVKLHQAIRSGVISFPRGLGKSRQQYIRDDNRRLGMRIYPDQFHAAEIVRGLLL